MVPSAIKNATRIAIRVSRVSLANLTPIGFIEYSNKPTILYTRVIAVSLSEDGYPSSSRTRNEYRREAKYGRWGSLKRSAPIATFSIRSALGLLLIIVAAGLGACAHTARIADTIHKSWLAARHPLSKSKPAAPQ